MAKAGRKRIEGERYPNGRLRKIKAERVPQAQIDEHLDKTENLTIKRLMYGKCTTAVYVILSGDDRSVKIGVSDNPAQRCASLQTAQEQQLRVFWAVRMTRENAFVIEQDVHTRLRRTCQHIRGEWYWMPANVAVDEINRALIARGYDQRPDLQFGFDRLMQEIG